MLAVQYCMLAMVRVDIHLLLMVILGNIFISIGDITEELTDIIL